MSRKRDLESLRLRQEQETAEYDEQHWESAPCGKNASLRNTVVKSAGNANVPVNNLHETVVANQFKEDASARPESRSRTVNPLPLQRQQQEIAVLQASPFIADAIGIKESSSVSHQQRSLSPWVAKRDRDQACERFNRSPFQDPLPNDHYLQSSFSRPRPST